MPDLNVSVTLGDSRYLRQVMYAPEMFIHQLPADLFECDRFDDPVFCCTVNRFKEVLDSMISEYYTCYSFAGMVREDIRGLPGSAEVTMCLWD